MGRCGLRGLGRCAARGLPDGLGVLLAAIVLAVPGRSAEPFATQVLSSTPDAGGHVAMASLQKRLVVVWPRKSGKLAARVSVDGGLSWQVPALDGIEPCLPGSAVAMVARNGRFHVVFVARRESGAEVRYASCGKQLRTWERRDTLGVAASDGANVSLGSESERGGGGRILAAWEGPRAGRVSLAWGDIGERTWWPSEEVRAPDGRCSWPAVAIVRAGGVAAFRVETGRDRIASLRVTRSGGPGQAWSAPAPAGGEGAGIDPGWPSLAALEERLLLQWSEDLLIGGRALRFAQSEDWAGSFRLARRQGEAFDNGRRSEMAVNGRAVASVWEDRSQQCLRAAISPDGGQRWSPAVRFWSYRSRTRPPAVAACGPDFYAAWVDDEGHVRGIALR
ncbi:MAG: hypothetical protein HY816_13865 [Candidatus Wallbacteria bacterium]|nr:hypothetical protein [Candidatus Wallbacteria bacterium]